MSLPYVKKEIYASLYKEIEELKDKGDEYYVSKQMRKIRKENPAIADWLKAYVKDRDNKTEILYCSIITYRLLESQDSANELNSMFQNDDEE